MQNSEERKNLTKEEERENKRLAFVEKLKANKREREELRKKCAEKSYKVIELTEKLTEETGKKCEFIVKLIEEIRKTTELGEKLAEETKKATELREKLAEETREATELREKLAEEMGKKKEVDADYECIACRNDIKKYIYLPCKHLCYCENCAKHAHPSKCPMCNKSGAATLTKIYI
jgi:hypothetical protein